ncbi:MAG: hypothetical protein WBD93_14710 [Acidobacteriaceae bacterium]
MSLRRLLILASIGSVALIAGCHKNAVDKSAFESAINTWYSAHPVCVWSAPVKFPAQADANNEDQTKGFDALTDAGMLTRTPAEKKRFLVGSKQVNDYDLSDKGRSTWTADPSQPGYGNFCVGHPSVTSIDSYTPADTADAAQYSVAYHYAVKNLPDWANTAEMNTAFPKLVTVTSGQQTATATLVKSNAGWQVTTISPSAGSGTLPQ